MMHVSVPVHGDIMIVDDHPANLRLLEDMLLQQGHEVRSFPLGRLALAAAKRNPPDLILLDINMPEMNGYEVCERLKAVQELADLPVIFLSALNETQDKVKAFQAGGVDYISKPFQLEEVHARVATHLKLYRLQRDLKLRNERLEEGVADIIFRWEIVPRRRVAYINPAANLILGYSPEDFYTDRQLISSIVHPDDRHIMEEMLRGVVSGTTQSTLIRYMHRNGNTVWIEQRNTLVRDSAGRLVAVNCVARDVTERKHLEEQLRQSQKMEAIGLLAGGVAHDFNNMLTVIMGFANLILSDEAPSPSVARKIGHIKSAAEKAVILTRQLLAFGRRQIFRPTLLNINSVVEHASEMFAPLLGADIDCVFDLDPELSFVKTDAAQIEQILVNLSVNAKGAMPGGGRLTIETRNVMLDGAITGGTWSGQLPYIMLAVTDTGCGMDASTRSRIFEPFYTTKEQGKGTGLGLSIVYGIVKQSAGDIRVFSEPGEGTRFEILLPATEIVEAAPAPPIQAVPEPASGCETILLVEDDSGVRQLVGLILGISGFEVLTAGDAKEALSVAEQHQGRIGLVLTDLIMPGMSGIALVASLRQLNHKIRVLYMSGYASDSVVAHGQLDPKIPFIQKPFSGPDLIRAIRETLAGGAAALESEDTVTYVDPAAYQRRW
jgi:two-component system cell cycle sensor histidine kinase/response regulator CckA